MTVKVRFFAYFRDLFGGRERTVRVPEGRTVGDLLELIGDTPGRRAELLSEGGLKPHIVVMLNGVHIQSLRGLETELSAGDTVAVFPFMAGG